MFFPALFLSLEEAEKIAAELKYLVVILPAYTMGGTGGGLVYNVDKLRIVASWGIAARFIGQPCLGLLDNLHYIV